MKNWQNRAIELLAKSLNPVPVELNELDWKSGLSDKTKRLAQHISAFANHPDGGFMIFGIDNNGKPAPLSQFKELRRKAVRVIVYKEASRINAIKEQEGGKGYASGFERMVRYIMDQLPTNEVIEKAIRKQVKMYPEKAIREFVANALIHQDLSITGTGIMIEIFPDRIEITNPGVPLVDTDRFIDTAPKSRNETLASLMRRLNICEERGSGIDRAIESIEVYQQNTTPVSLMFLPVFSEPVAFIISINLDCTPEFRLNPDTVCCIIFPCL